MAARPFQYVCYYMHETRSSCRKTKVLWLYYKHPYFLNISMDNMLNFDQYKTVKVLHTGPLKRCKRCTRLYIPKAKLTQRWSLSKSSWVFRAPEIFMRHTPVLTSNCTVSFQRKSAVPFQVQLSSKVSQFYLTQGETIWGVFPGRATKKGDYLLPCAVCGVQRKLHIHYSWKKITVVIQQRWRR